MLNKFKLIFLILLFYQANSYKEARDFLIELVKTTKNGKILKNLSEQCLGKFFDYRCLLLKKSYKQNDFVNAAKNLENVVIDTFLNCPTDDLLSIFDDNFIDYYSSDSEFDKKIYSKLIGIGRILLSDVYTNKNINGASLGRTVGKIFNLLKANYTEQKELNSDDTSISPSSLLDIKEEDYFEFIAGIFAGMKEKEDEKESECYKDILKGKSKIMKKINDGMKKLDEGKGFGETLTGIIFGLVTVEGLVVDCNLLNLGSNIFNKVTSFKGMTELLMNIMSDSGVYLLYGGLIYDNFLKKNLKECGKYIGKIISKVFDFHVK